MTENAVYLDLSKIEDNEVAYLMEMLEMIFQDYCSYRAGTFPEFMSDRYGVEVVEDGLKAIDELSKRIEIKPHLNLH